MIYLFTFFIIPVHLHTIVIYLFMLTYCYIVIIIVQQYVTCVYRVYIWVKHYHNIATEKN